MLSLGQVTVPADPTDENVAFDNLRNFTKPGNNTPYAGMQVLTESYNADGTEVDFTIAGDALHPNFCRRYCSLTRRPCTGTCTFDQLQNQGQSLFPNGLLHTCCDINGCCFDIVHFLLPKGRPSKRYLGRSDTRLRTCGVPGQYRSCVASNYLCLLGRR